jgi:hypothetical protein
MPGKGQNLSKLGHITPTSYRTPMQNHALRGRVNYADDYDGNYTGSVSSVTVEPEDLHMMADKKYCEVLTIMPLNKVRLQVTPLNHYFVFALEVIPDSGAMIMEIPAQKTSGLTLSSAKRVL